MKPSDYGLPDDAAGYVCYQEGDEWCCHDTLVDAVDEYVSECLFVNKINDTGCRDCEVYLASVRKNRSSKYPILGHQRFATGTVGSGKESGEDVP